MAKIAIATHALPADYGAWLGDIKGRVTAARQRAVLAANAELIQLYWQIGHDILQRQQAHSGATRCWTGWRATCAKPFLK
jgi:hypothetical protein